MTSRRGLSVGRWENLCFSPRVGDGYGDGKRSSLLSRNGPDWWYPVNSTPHEVRGRSRTHSTGKPFLWWRLRRIWTRDPLDKTGGWNSKFDSLDMHWRKGVYRLQRGFFLYPIKNLKYLIFPVVRPWWVPTRFWTLMYKMSYFSSPLGWRNILCR